MYALKTSEGVVEITRKAYRSLLGQFAGKVNSFETIGKIFITTTHILPDGRELYYIVVNNH